MKSLAPTSRGFTLVEMLVVIAIIGVLTAMLIPAVQYARERARQTTCFNNLRQFGIAVQLHNSQHQHFPNAGLFDESGPTWNHPPKIYINNQTKLINATATGKALDGWGWAYQILPFMEQTQLHAAAPAEAAGAVLDGFHCPTRSRQEAIAGQGCSLPQGLRGRTDYAGNGGWGNGVGLAAVDTERYPDPDSTIKPNGAIIPVGYFNGSPPSFTVEFDKVGLGNIADGASATLLIGERNYSSASNGNELTHPDEDNGYVAGYTWDTIRWAYSPPIEDDAIVADRNTRFGSSHSGGAQYVFCDGHTAYIPYETDPLVFRAVCGRDDKKSPEIP
jgi:prepilin-type N-terminal cleavage/methylation domain-containing protein/prepilin-type processing-associated H-X9-DG protein